MVDDTIVLITGGNRGIGLAIVESLASHPQTRGWTLLLGCRDLNKGNLAIAEVAAKDIMTDHIRTVQIDVTSDDSIRSAASHIQSTYQRLDVLINNAGFAMQTSAPDLSDVRQAFSKTYDTNVTSVMMTTSLLLPLLLVQSPSKSKGIKKVINISSARGSMTRSASGQLPPTASAAYSISKTALNALTLELSRQTGNEDVEFQLACPGHCKTAFNGYRGVRDPLEGANVVICLILGERKETGCWETVGSDMELKQVPW